MIIRESRVNGYRGSSFQGWKPQLFAVLGASEYGQYEA
jgi:hypothetical protein